MAQKRRKCAREGCNKTFRPNRSKLYCSTACRNKAYADMHKKPEVVIAENVHAMRTCLRCGNKFGSESIANRICPTCKQINNRVGRIARDRWS